jgi:MioC protein
MDEVLILVGTMSGNAEMVADALAAQLKKKTITARVRDMSECTVETLEPGRIYIICSSTYGEGDVPDNAVPFYEALIATKPDLTGIRYGVVGLGDRVYENTFNGGPKRFDELFTSLGAIRVGERLENDASSGAFPDEVAVAWLKEWLKNFATDGVA